MGANRAYAASALRVVRYRLVRLLAFSADEMPIEGVATIPRDPRISAPERNQPRDGINVAPHKLTQVNISGSQFENHS